MREYVINNITHTVYDSIDEVPVNIKYIEWKDSKL